MPKRSPELLKGIAVIYALSRGHSQIHEPGHPHHARHLPSGRSDDEKSRRACMGLQTKFGVGSLSGSRPPGVFEMWNGFGAEPDFRNWRLPNEITACINNQHSIRFFADWAKREAFNVWRTSNGH